MNLFSCHVLFEGWAKLGGHLMCKVLINLLSAAGDTAPLPVAGSRSAAAARPMAVRGTPTSFKVNVWRFCRCDLALAYVHLSSWNKLVCHTITVWYPKSALLWLLL